MFLYMILPLDQNKSVNKKWSTDSILPEVPQAPPKAIKIFVTESRSCNIFGHCIAIDTKWIRAGSWIAYRLDFARLEPITSYSIVSLVAIKVIIFT